MVNDPLDGVRTQIQDTLTLLGTEIEALEAEIEERLAPLRERLNELSDRQVQLQKALVALNPDAAAVHRQPGVSRGKASDELRGQMAGGTTRTEALKDELAQLMPGLGERPRREIRGLLNDAGIDDFSDWALKAALNELAEDDVITVIGTGAGTMYRWEGDAVKPARRYLTEEEQAQLEATIRELLVQEPRSAPALVTAAKEAGVTATKTAVAKLMRRWREEGLAESYEQVPGQRQSSVWRLIEADATGRDAPRSMAESLSSN